MKALYYGDNLQVLRDSIATESVDLIISIRRSTRMPPTMSAFGGKAVVIGCVAEPPLVTKCGPKMVLNVSWIGPHIETLSLLGHIESLQKLCDVRAPTSWLVFFDSQG